MDHRSRIYEITAITPIEIPFPGRRTRRAVQIVQALLLVLITLLSFTAALPSSQASKAGGSQSHSSAAECTITPSNSTILNANDTEGCFPSAFSQTDSSLSTGPQFPGVDAVPDLSLPRTVLSSVDNLIGAGDLIQSSPDNFTLFNPLIKLRMLGGTVPHDELLNQASEVVSSNSVWGVEVYAGGIWLPLLPSTSNFTPIGTNTTGTYVTRTMVVSNGVYSGSYQIDYEAVSNGPLKWVLSFQPLTEAVYRLTYSLGNVTGEVSLDQSSRELRTDFGTGSNYTLSWADVSPSFNSSSNIANRQFSLEIDLGNILSGARVQVDPTIGTSSSASATASTFQRRVFYEPTGGYYWAFYYAGLREVYTYSFNGVSWTPSTQIPDGIVPLASTRNICTPKCVSVATSAAQAATLPAIFQSGQTVVIASGEEKHLCCGQGPSPWSMQVSLNYTVGKISGHSITWDPVKPLVPIDDVCDNDTTNCYMLMGIRYVNIGVT